MIFDHAIVNGKHLPLEQAQISIFDKAVFSSFGVYEAVKVDRGRPFYLREHLQRLLQSARMIELELSADLSTLVAWFQTLNQLDPQATWRLTIIAFGPLEAGAEALIAMRPETLQRYPQRLYDEGASAVLYAGRRAVPGCKSLNNLVNYLAQRAAGRAGALEGLLHHGGRLTEGGRSNLFAVRQGQLVTPPAAQVLSGITRDIIIQLMQATDCAVIEKPLSTDLSQYDELFISSTSMHVMPVTRVEGRPVGTGRVGPVTKNAAARFEAHYRQVMADGRG